jgi:lantibiotic modifying enzyme
MMRLTDVRCPEKGPQPIPSVSPTSYCQTTAIAGKYNPRIATIYERLSSELFVFLNAAGQGQPAHHPSAATRNFPYLYNGTCGIAIFLAALYSVTNDPRAAKLALQCVHDLQVKIAQLARQPELLARRKVAVGGFIGLGSFLYTFVRLSRWLEEPCLMRSAGEIVELLSPAIQADEELDVLNGCAGLLLALLLMRRQEQATPAVRLRAYDLARVCGEHLLTKRKPYSSGHYVWAGNNRPPLTGFAHGAAGIAYALLMLFAETGDKRFRAAALEGFAFERDLFCPDRKNWMDPRTGALLEQSAWCHGAPGILLSRLGSLSVVDVPELRRDIEQSLAIVQDMALMQRDHLCCGNFGRIEVLLASYQKLQRQDLLDSAFDVASRVLERTTNIGFCFERAGEVADPSSMVHYSLFCGLAGVGYSLLRLTHPTRFPSLLMLE